MKLILIWAAFGAQKTRTHQWKADALKKEATVWCGFWSRGIIGPFFENKQGEAVTDNDDRYRAMLNEFFFTKIEEEDIGNIWFQQHGAKCHPAEVPLDVLCPVFEDSITSRRADVIWPPRSCDLTPLNYHLLGAVKDKCNADKSETIDALKDNIREVIGEMQLHTIFVFGPKLTLYKHGCVSWCVSWCKIHESVRF